MAQAKRTYSDIDPHCDWISSEEFDTLLVDLPGFKKEDLKAQVDTARNLVISGECNPEENMWRRFRKSFQIAKESEIRGIKAKFDQDILYVMVPKPKNLPGEDGNRNGSESNGGSLFNEDNNVQQLQGNYYNQMTWRNLGKQKQVILNVFIVILLVGLVLFTTYRKRPSQPQNFSDAS